MNKSTISLFAFLFAGIIACSGQTFVIKTQSFVGDKGELVRYTAFDRAKPDAFIVVKMQDNVLSLKVGESYVVGTYILSGIYKEPNMTADSLNIYTFKATDVRTNGIMDVSMQYNPFDKWAIMEIPYADDALIKREVLLMVEVGRDDHSFIEIDQTKGPDNTHVLCVSENKDFDPFEIEKSDILRLYLVKGGISKNTL